MNSSYALLVSITPSSASIAEGTNGNFTITRTGGGTGSDLTVSLMITPANADMTTGDYTLSGGSISGQTGGVTVTIPAGSASVTVNFAALVDAVGAESDNVLTLALVDAADYDLDTSNSATATIPANDLVVTNLNDSGEGSLRQAITNANAFSSDDTITFTTSGNIDLSSVLPSLANNGTLTINGGGAITVNRSSTTQFLIFNVRTGANVTLNGLTITNGSSSSSGGGISSDGTLTITNSTVSSNYASIAGGGIEISNGTVTIISSIISGNTAASYGGGIAKSSGTMTIINSLISGNVANGSASFEGGGGLALYGSDGTTTILNSTISGNTASGQPTRAGIWSVLGTLNLQNTIVSSNGSGDCQRDNGTVNAQNSLIGTGLTCVNGTNTGNLTGDPMLNGDFTLSGTSIAINAGDNSLIAGYPTDLLGNPRIQVVTVDMGAYELSFATPPTLVSITPSSASITEGTNSDFTITRTGGTSGDLTVSLMITPANADMTLSDYLLSGGSISGQTGSVTVVIPAGQASVNVNFAALDDVDAEPVNTLTLALVDATGYDLDTSNSATATIPANDFVVTNLNDSGEGSLRQAITNANAFNSDDTITFTTSGIINLRSVLPDLANRGSLTINGGGAITVHRSSATQFRIFFVLSKANVTLNGLTITNGDTRTLGGGIQNGGTLTITNSVISGNSASTAGGGIYNAGSTLTITNSRISGNVANGSASGSGGGGLDLNVGSTTTILNSTISGNTAPKKPKTAGIWNEFGSTLTLQNTIVAGNGSTDCNNGSSTINAQNSLIGTGLTCVNGTNTNNLTGDPMLNGDFTLSSSSSAINAGDNSLIAGYPTDLLGNPRIQGGTVDMGAYELSYALLVSITPSSASIPEGTNGNFTITRTGGWHGQRSDRELDDYASER